VNKTYPSPLNDGDMATLTALAHKGNVLTADPHVAPMYLCADGGDDDHPDAWLFLCWPSRHPLASRAGRMALLEIARIAMTELGAELQHTCAPEGDR